MFPAPGYQGSSVVRGWRGLSRLPEDLRLSKIFFDAGQNEAAGDTRAVDKA